MEGRHALQRCERDLQRVALGALRRLRHQGPRALGQAHAGRRAEVQQRRFGRLGVVAQRGHRLPPAVEVHRQLRGGDRHAGGALAFEGRAHLAVQLHARRRRRAVVQHLAEQRMPEGIRQLRRIAASAGTRRGEPHLLAHQLVAGQGHRGDVAPQGQRQRVDAELDPADRGRREQRALLAAEPGDVVVDDGRQVLGHGHRREARLRGRAVRRCVPSPR